MLSLFKKEKVSNRELLNNFKCHDNDMEILKTLWNRAHGIEIEFREIILETFQEIPVSVLRFYIMNKITINFKVSLNSMLTFTDQQLVLFIALNRCKMNCYCLLALNKYKGLIMKNYARINYWELCNKKLTMLDLREVLKYLGPELCLSDFEPVIKAVLPLVYEDYLENSILEIICDSLIQTEEDTFAKNRIFKFAGIE